jgi:hypothetical protein
VKGASAKKDAIVDALEEAGKVERKPKTSFETVPAEKLLKESA